MLLSKGADLYSLGLSSTSVRGEEGLSSGPRERVSWVRSLRGGGLSGGPDLSPLEKGVKKGGGVNGFRRTAGEGGGRSHFLPIWRKETNPPWSGGCAID